MNIRGPSSNNALDIRWVTAYNFTIPSKNNKLTMWKVEAVLGTPFIVGGSIGLMIEQMQDDIDKNHGSTPNSMPDLKCRIEGNCTVGIRSRMNENSLTTLLRSGTYRLWIYDAIGEKNSDIASCIPFSFSLKITSEEITENYITCEAHRLPDSLLPGLYDEPPGFVHYRLVLIYSVIIIS
jgi:hypothetical protein